MGNDETHIIHRILKGETSLYEYFLDKYSQQVFILIIRIVENQEDAEELTQDTFLKAFEHLSSFKAESSLYLANLHTSFLCNLIYPTFSRILLYSC